VHGITYRSAPWVPIRAGELTVDRAPYRVLDGNDPGSLWTGQYLGSDLLPHSHGGTRGWIGTANDEPYGLTEDGSIIGDPLYFGVYFDPGTRAQRIESEVARYVARGAVTRDDMLALQDDTYLLFTEHFLPPLLAAWDARATDTTLAPYATRADLAALVEGLRSWDRRMERSSPDAVVFNAFMFELAREVLADDMSLLFDPIMGQSPTFVMKLLALVADDTTANGDSFFQHGRTLAYVRALDAVATYLTTRFGTTDRTMYTWESVHDTRFDSIWGASGGPLDGGAIATDGSLGTINVSESRYFDDMRMPRARLEAGGGSIFRLAVQFRDDGTPDAVVNIPRGVSGDPTSPHFDDLQADWQVNHSRPLAFLRADVEAHAEERFTIPAAH
jgi:penicillin amidase